MLPICNSQFSLKNIHGPPLTVLELLLNYESKRITDGHILKTIVEELSENIYIANNVFF